jgi:hypothetical protein
MNIMDFFEDIMNSIPKNDEEVIVEKNYKDIVDKVSFNFDANIKKDIQNLVKLEMRVKKCKENKGCMDKQSKTLIDRQISDIKKRIDKYRKGLDDPSMKEGLEVYIKKCYDDYGPSSLFYASIQVPKSVKESEDMLKDESIADIFTEASDDDDDDSEGEDDVTDTDPEDDIDNEEPEETGSDVKADLLDKIQSAFDDADYKLKITDKNREAFLNNKKSFMTDANGICLVLGKNDYNKKKSLLKEVVAEYKDDFNVSEDNNFTCFVNVKPKSSLYVKNVKESVYSLITDDMDTYIESPYITDEDYMLEEATREGDPSLYKKPEETTGDNATPNNENEPPEEKEFCIAAMLPQCGSTDGCGNPGDVMKDIKKVDKASDKNLNGIELPDDIEIESTLQEYVENLDISYDIYVENAVGDFVDKVKTNAKISKEALKSAADKGLAKARYARAKFDAKLGKLKEDVSEKLHEAKSGFVNAEKRFRINRKKLKEAEAAELDAVAEKVFEMYNAKTVQEATEMNTIKVENFASLHKKIKKACDIYEKMNPNITPFSKLTEKSGIKSLSGDMIYINPDDKKMNRTLDKSNTSKVCEYYDGKTLVLRVMKDVDIDTLKRVKPTFSLAYGFDVQWQMRKDSRINVVYDAVSTECKKHIDYYLAAWMAKNKLGNNSIINWAKYIISSSKSVMKEGFEVIDERDELVEMLEKAMIENDMDVIKSCQNKIKYIDNREQRLGLVVTLEAANIDAEIKPIIAELNRKGYKTKYSSAGHTKLRKKEDVGRDGVYYGKLYSDARIMFDDDYDFPKAPKHWVWKSVEGKDYLDIIPQTYDSKDGTPDEAFAKWKANYMGTLRTWVDNLPEKSKAEDKVIVKDTKGREKVNE